MIEVIGPVCFGVVVGWITYRTLRRAPKVGVSDLASVIGAVGGASVTAALRPERGAFNWYCVGLAVGFFGYLLVGAKLTEVTWLGSDE
jgi:NhaP-type Na+/H+ or K+/H+ antiporter